MKFQSNAQNREEIVKRLEELTGLDSIYLGAPSFAYGVGDYTVEQDGSLAVEDVNMDRAVVAALLDEGMIAGELPALPQDIPPAEDKTAEVAGVTISLPLDGHTGASFRNLLTLLHSKGSLLSQATGGIFAVDKELLYLLDAADPTASPQELWGMVERYESSYGGVQGIKITEGQIIFTGFGEPQDAAHTRAYMELASRMNRMSITQKRIQAKTVDEENPKYAMHGFLIRLGMNGADFRESRRLLMERLPGNQAFRTPEQAERAKVKNAQRYKERKEARGNAAGSLSETVEPTEPTEPELCAADTSGM